MALTTYAELQDSVADWLNRDDLTEQVKDFITLAEAEIRRRLKRRTRRATVQIAAATRPLPLDCAELRDVRLVTGVPTRDRSLIVCTPTMLADERARHAQTGRPRFCAVVGGELLLVPAPDAAYTAELTYYEALEPLSEDQPTNAVLTEAPDLYLYGALLQAAPFLQHDERIPTWQVRVDAAVAQLNEKAQREEYSASYRPVRLPVVI